MTDNDDGRLAATAREIERVAGMVWAPDEPWERWPLFRRRALAAVRGCAGDVAIALTPAGYAVEVTFERRERGSAFDPLAEFGPAFKEAQLGDLTDCRVTVGARADGTVYRDLEGIPSTLRSACDGPLGGTFETVSALAATATAYELVRCSERADAPLLSRRTLWFRCRSARSALNAAASLGSSRDVVSAVALLLGDHAFEFGVDALERRPVRFRLRVAANALSAMLHDIAGPASAVLATLAEVRGETPVAVELVAGAGPGVGLRVRTSTAELQTLAVRVARPPLAASALLALAGPLPGDAVARARATSALLGGELAIRLGADDGDDLREHAVLFARAVVAAVGDEPPSWMLPVVAPLGGTLERAPRTDRSLWR